MTNCEAWVENNISEDKDEMNAIGELAIRNLNDNFAISLNSSCIPIAIYGTIFEVIKDVLKEKKEEYADYSINIANRVSIGYNNYDNDDAEKNGNFGVFIKHLTEATSLDTGLSDEENNTIELATQWNASNITNDIEVIQQISDKARKRLDVNLDLQIGSNELIMPIFITVHEAMLSVLAVKKSELEVCDYELNMCGMYRAEISESEDGETSIKFTVPIDLRLEIKNDLTAQNRAK